MHASGRVHGGQVVERAGWRGDEERVVDGRDGERGGEGSWHVDDEGGARRQGGDAESVLPRRPMPRSRVPTVPRSTRPMRARAEAREVEEHEADEREADEREAEERALSTEMEAARSIEVSKAAVGEPRMVQLGEMEKAKLRLKRGLRGLGVDSLRTKGNGRNCGLEGDTASDAWWSTQSGACTEWDMRAGGAWE